MVRPPMTHVPMTHSPFLINKPIDVMSAIHAASPRIHSQSKKVWFGNDAVSGLFR